MTKRAALGKGLGALISDMKEVQAKAERPSNNANNPVGISEIAIELIEPNPFQPRTTFDEIALNDLAESIKQLGLIQPITVRCIEDGKYQIISGERRFRAAKIAGLEFIPAYIRRADDQGMLEMAIVENIQREDLDAIEVALSFQRLIEECDLTQEAMAVRVGKGRATVTNYLRLLKLPAEIQLAVRAGRVTMGHAKAILSIEDPGKQLELCNLVIENDLSVRQVENRVQKMKVKKSDSQTEQQEQELPESYYKLLEILGKYFDNNISLKRSDKGKGSITISFKDDKEIENLINVLENNVKI